MTSQPNLATARATFVRSRDLPARGATAVEFAVVASVFLMMLFGVLEVGRALWVWNAAAEATRYGARLAVVCDMGDVDIKRRMRDRLPLLTDPNIAVTYEPAACNVNTCESVTITLSGVTVTTAIPFATFAPSLPPFRTMLTRESMSSTSAAGDANPVCL